MDRYRSSLGLHVTRPLEALELGDPVDVAA